MTPFMPRPEDYTRMWWRAGFPKRCPGAPWHRCVATGNYAFVLDTQSLSIPHIGKFAGGPLSNLPSAELSLNLTVNGKVYRAKSAKDATRFTGPRIIESGNFLQRADVTNLIFTAEDGSVLNQKSRLETAAWGDRLGIILSAQPGRKPIQAGDVSFGRVRGGFGLTGQNRFDLSEKECPISEKFTLSFHVFVPHNFKASKHAPWLVCKNRHEQREGNFGIKLSDDGTPSATINIGGGRENIHSVQGSFSLKREQWNHVAISYDGETLRLFVNRRYAAESKLGKKYIPVAGGLCFGDRQDGAGQGAFRFRGIIDEIALHDRALSLNELRFLGNHPEKNPANRKPVKRWSFRSDIAASPVRISEKWKSASLEIGLSSSEGKKLHSKWKLPPGKIWEAPDWRETAIVFDPTTFQAVESPAGINVEATEKATGRPLTVTYESNVGWHKINLDTIEPIPPAGSQSPTNDAIERIRLHLFNTGKIDQTVRLMFEKNGPGFRQRIGSSITGMSAILRDTEGNPTGIPCNSVKTGTIIRKAEFIPEPGFMGSALSVCRRGKNSTSSFQSFTATGAGFRQLPILSSV